MSEAPKLHAARPVGEKFPISSPFAQRTINGKQEYHNGIDFAVPAGTPIQAVIEGQIFRADWQDREDKQVGFGLRIWQVATISGMTYDVFYGHCSELLVKEGDHVTKGQIIAKSGNTGRSTGPHLHMGFRRAKDGQWCDVVFEANLGEAK